MCCLMNPAIPNQIMEACFKKGFGVNRFRVLESAGGWLHFRDRLRPGERVMHQDDFQSWIGLQQDIRYFQFGFMDGTLSLIGDTVRSRPAGAADAMFWQFPCCTEADAWQRHASLKHPVLRENILHIYLGLPWATWIDMQHKVAWRGNAKAQLERQVAMLSVRISGWRRALAEMDVQLAVHTVCQHIYWRGMLDTWTRVGVTDAWLSHCPADSGDIEERCGLTLHPWSLYAVNVEDAARREGVVVGKAPADKTVLASFIGAHMPHYLSNVRLQLLKLADEPGMVVRLADQWHFENVVYEHQIGGKPLVLDKGVSEAVIEYNRVLSDSVFALCPAGAGANTLRFWEALAVGAIPVLLGHAPELPRGGSLEDIDWGEIVVQAEHEDLCRLPDFLKSFSMDEVRARQLKAMAAFEAVRNQRCFTA